MKKDIHPKIYKDCTVTCACGNSFVTISTQQTIKVDICSACHPFYTGQQRFVDTEGRIEKFKKKLQKSQEKMAKVEAIKKARKQKEKATNPQKDTKGPSLKDLRQKT